MFLVSMGLKTMVDVVGNPEERMMSDKFKTWSITIDMHEESESK